MLELFYSNRYETLSATLLDDLGRMEADVWRPQPVIVPSAAIRRRLELDYANRFGVCANVQFGYLAQWLWSQIGRVGGIDVPSESPFAPERLVWRIYRLLDARTENGSRHGAQADSRLDAYLDAADPAMRYELAQRVATVFDHYLTYRPQWLAQWQSGGSIFATEGASEGGPRLVGASSSQRADETWQATLWRRVLAELAGAAGHDTMDAISPPAYRFLSIAGGLDLDDVGRTGWPPHVCVFALPSMPPLHVQLLRELSRWIDVRIYTLNPCREYWFDIVTQRRADALDLAGQRDYQSVGHPLLAEWGRQTQAQLAMLHELTEGAVAGEAADFVPSPASNWLAVMQNAILELEHPVIASPRPVENGVEVHVCHSLARQFEVLHDRLLAAFAEDETLTPADVLVAVPDLAAAAPLVDAVFGALPATDPRRIPYRTTGLPPSSTNPIARVLLDWLTLAEREPTAAELIEWLRVDAIAARYGIDAASLEAVQGWLAAAGARRGLAPAGDEGGDAPPVRHTFGDALTRLFLGYAMPDGAPPVADWLPIPGASGSDADLLGRLAQFVDDVEALANECSVSHSAAQWRTVLLAALDRFFDPGSPYADALTDLRDTLDDLFQRMIDGAPHLPVPAAVMRSALAQALDDPAPGGVPWGGVTFSSLSSLRGVPFRIVCVLGMDDGVLPSVARAHEFDLIAAFGQMGDRQRRDDERNLFLDLILAARERVLIGYTGRNIRDNAPLPPSALVDELLDHLAQLRAGEGADLGDIAQARATFIVDHPLQPFAQPYFESGGPLYTYDVERAAIAAALSASARSDTRDASLPFFRAPLPADERTEIAFDDFERFWRHPLRALLRERLGIVLHDAAAELSDAEPYEIDYEGRDALAQRVLPRLIESPDSIEVALGIARASPELPGGATGAFAYEREVASLRTLAERIGGALRGGVEAVEFSLDITPHWPDGLESVSPLLDAAPNWREAALSPVTLSGVLSGGTRDGLLIYRYASPSARDYLSAWLRHLCWCVARPDAPPRTRWLGDGTSFMFGPPDDSMRQLSALVALYRVGLRVPLRFFPKSAWLWVTQIDAAARNAWSNDRTGGERDDAAIQLALRGTSLTLDGTFAALARRVFEPLVAHLHLEGAQ